MKYVSQPPHSSLMNIRMNAGKIWRGGRRILTNKRLALLGSIVAVGLITVPIITYATYANDIADKERLMNHNSTGIILRDKNGEIFYEFGRLSGESNVTLDRVSDTFENTLIASEDRDFRNHEGYSMRGMAAAMYANVLNKDATRYGGSTITQQLVKNKLLTSDKSYFRKYQEVSMAVAVERRYEKNEILEMYMNSVYLGEGAFGIGDAAKTYFNKSPQDLNLAESSMLVGLLPAPSIYSPISGDMNKAKDQQEIVLTRMVNAGAISEDEKKATLAQPLAFNEASVQKQEHAQHFAMMVLEEAKKKYGEENIIRGGYDITTTLDLNWQKQAEANVRERVQALSSAGARNAGLVAIDPKNGQIRSLVGSVDWNNPTFGKVNMAAQMRQPGSSFKPIYYAEALNKKLVTPATILKDQPKTYGRSYAPTNYDFKYRGDISVRDALSQSLNIPAVDVMQKLGVKEASITAQRMGISTVTEPEKYGLSLALGTAEVKLSEMVNAYSAFANKGHQYQPTIITGIQDKYNNKIFEYEQAAPKRVATPEASYLISSILSDNEARAPTFGNNLTLPNNRKVPVKTGTTNDSKDAWTIGYTPSIAVGVWMGNNENEPMVGLAGSSSAGGVWRNTMSNFLGNTPNEDFHKPDSVVALQICKGTELKTSKPGDNTREEFFIKGGEPTGECNSPKQEEKNNEEKKPEKPREDDNEDENRNENQKKQREGSSAPPQPLNTATPKPEPEQNEGGRGGGDGTAPAPAPTPPPSEPAPTPPPATDPEPTT